MVLLRRIGASLLVSILALCMTLMGLFVLLIIIGLFAPDFSANVAGGVGYAAGWLAGHLQRVLSGISGS